MEASACDDLWADRRPLLVLRAWLTVRPLTVRQADLAVGVAFLVLGLLVLYGSGGLAYMDRGQPGPGFMPRCIGVGLALIGVGIVVSRLRQRQLDQEPLSLPDMTGFGRVAVGLALLGALAVSLEAVGYVLATAVSTFVLLVVLERQPLIKALVVSVLLPVAFYLMFRTWLGLPLPTSPIGL